MIAVKATINKRFNDKKHSGISEETIAIYIIGRRPDRAEFTKRFKSAFTFKV
jgi:hypothetical protein